MALSSQLLLGNLYVSLADDIRHSCTVWWGWGVAHSVIRIIHEAAIGGEKFVTFHSSYQNKFDMHPVLDLKMCVKIF